MNWVAKRLRVVAFVAATGSLLSFGGRLSVWFEKASHFPVQCCLGLMALAALLLLFRDGKAATLTFLIALLHLTRFATEIVPFVPSADGASGPVIKIVGFNILTSNDRFDLVNAYLKEQQPDVLLIAELGDEAVKNVDFAAAGLVPVEQVVRQDNFGMGLYARASAQHSAVIYPGGVTTPVVDATFQGFRVLGVHPIPLMNSAALGRRNNQLLAVAKLAAKSKVPVVMMGDFNLTPWSPYFGDLLEAGNLEDSRRAGGGGLQTTWPTDHWYLRIPIDHALVSAGIVVLSREVGPNLGSDHFPVVLKIALKK